jgi:hypothetical protein
VRDRAEAPDRDVGPPLIAAGDGQASRRVTPHRALVVAATFVVVGIVSIAVALAVTPERSVSAFGQTVALGTAPPS